MTIDDPVSGHSPRGDEDADLVGLAIRLQETFGWPDPAVSYRITGTWERPRSGSRFIRLSGEPDGPDLVVKMVETWVGDDALRSFEALGELVDLIDSAGIGGTHGLTPLAWSDDPPALVTGYVESLDLVSILRQPAHGAWADDRLGQWIERAGMVLACYHLSAPEGWRPDPAEASTEVHALARKLRLDPRSVEGLLVMAGHPGAARRRYGDYGPGNFQGAADGGLYLLDPPTEAWTSMIHRDISNFLFEMRRQLAGRGFSRSEPVRGRYPDLRERFLLGYRRSAPEVVFGSADEALLALFEVKRAVALARKRFPGRAGDAAWFARLAMRRRHDLLRAITATGQPE